MNFPSSDVLKLFKETRGAISVHEACAIYWLAQQAPEGDAIDLGTHCGKAAIMAAAGLPVHSKGKGRLFHLVDPAFDKNNREAWSHSDQKIPEKAWQGFFEEGFSTQVRDRVAKVAIIEEFLPQITYKTWPWTCGDYSLHAIPAINGPFSYAFIDSDQHQYKLVKAELELLRNRMVIGGIIGFHDFDSQFTGVERAMREMLQGGQYEEIGIPWQDIKPWVKENGGEEGNDSWHHMNNPAPCYLGALIRRK